MSEKTRAEQLLERLINDRVAGAGPVHPESTIQYWSNPFHVTKDRARLVVVAGSDEKLEQVERDVRRSRAFRAFKDVEIEALKVDGETCS